MENLMHSDLAWENFGKSGDLPSGTVKRREQVGEIGILHFQIPAEQDTEAANYVTYECGNLNYLSTDASDRVARLIAGELRGMAKRLTGKLADASFSVFVAGLGNGDLTADAIGPLTVHRLTATRHLQSGDADLYRRLGCSALSALAPGVLGQTGIETLEILAGAVAVVKPDLVIVVDALAARSCERLASVIQVADIGLAPGSGVGNCRAAIDRKTLGIPVISVGVPTVVHSATLVRDALEAAGCHAEDEALCHVLENRRSFFVTPKESDLITQAAAQILSRAIGLAFVGELCDA